MDNVDNVDNLRKKRAEKEKNRKFLLFYADFQKSDFERGKRKNPQSNIPKKGILLVDDVDNLFF